MQVTSINAETLAKMVIAGAKNLEARKEWINELNVFPVPDGDTGTNMTMTIMSAVREIEEIENPSMEQLSKVISSGSLRGARGNSGVILSQLFRGFCKVIKKYDMIDVAVLSEAFQRAVETAYKAVMKPKEGTILTVARGMADRAIELLGVTTDLVYFMDELIKRGDEVLEQTPEMLPVLKEAGVVDSGGQGLMQVLKGAYDVILGRDVDYAAQEASENASDATEEKAAAEEEITFGYCTEFIILANESMSVETEQDYKSYLESLGDSIVVVADSDVIKTHVHTNDPGLVLTKALTYGALSHIKIDNMREEHQEKLAKAAAKAASSVNDTAAETGNSTDGSESVVKNTSESVSGQKGQEASKDKTEMTLETESKASNSPMEEVGFIAVSIGEGINEIFQGLGVNCIVEGGQTMNPSTEDILNAISRVNAKNIFILPNNSNIVLAAKQAASLTEDKQVYVLPTKTIPQGISAMVNYIPTHSAEENAEIMAESIASVKTGQVTYAVRDTQIEGIAIHQNDYMGIGDEGILSAGTDLQTVTVEMTEAMIDEDSAIISIYYGADVTEEQAQELSAAFEEKYPELEVEINNGSQPIYYYVISVE